MNIEQKRNETMFGIVASPDGIAPSARMKSHPALPSKAIVGVLKPSLPFENSPLLSINLPTVNARTGRILFICKGNQFSSCLNGNSRTFRSNAKINRKIRKETQQRRRRKRIPQSISRAHVSRSPNRALSPAKQPVLNAAACQSSYKLGS